MGAWRQAIELSINDADLAKLTSIARSRTEPASRVERARMLLAYRENPTFYAVGQALGIHHQTVQRCVERALAYGPIAALDDRARPGREPTITPEAKAWLVSLACRKAKDLGYPHELWTTRLLARHAQEHGPGEGHPCFQKVSQGTVCKILNEQEIKPHKVRYYLERRDPEFKEKMAEVLCVYREVKILKETAAAAKTQPGDAVAIISYDELCRPRHSSSYAGRRTMPGGSGTTRCSCGAVAQDTNSAYLPLGIVCLVTAIQGRQAVDHCWGGSAFACRIRTASTSPGLPP
jgi:transposase